MWEEYSSPKSVQEALEILQSCKGQARIIAGGTDLIPELKEQTRKVKCLVDIVGIEPLKKIEQDGDNIKIGAGVTHSDVASSKLIRKKAAVLAEAASAVGSPLIRNQGTVVGNVVNAQPAADTAVALSALEAKAEITFVGGVRLIPLDELYEGIGVSKIDSTSEIVTSLHFKSLTNDQGSAFDRLARRKALALPMLNVAVVVTVQNGRFEEARIMVAPVAPMPFRARRAEAALRGTATSLDSINKAAGLAAVEAQPRDSQLRGSAEYRKEMVKVLVRRALEQATQRAKQR
ncbi:Carbon monoxide dehydrogenase medium chain [subsurface metagenome]